MKNSNKGITLLALIITIIVMIILAGVSLSMLFGEEGIVTQARKASKEWERQAKLEKVIAEIQFNPNTAGKRMKPETVMKLAIAIVDNGLEIDELAVVYEPKDGEEYLAYKYDETRTREEKMKLESQGIYLLKGDVNEDGIIDEDDVKFLDDVNWMIIPDGEYNPIICDMNGDGGISITDVVILENILGTGELKFSEINPQATNYNKHDVGTRKNMISAAMVWRYPEGQYHNYQNQLTIYGDHVLYKYNLVPEVERKIVEDIDEYKTKAGYYIGVKMLKGDANLDGTFTLDDINLIEKNIEEDIDFTSVQTTIIDMDNNDKIDEQDVERLKKVLNGEAPMYPEWAE